MGARERRLYLRNICFCVFKPALSAWPVYLSVETAKMPQGIESNVSANTRSQVFSALGVWMLEILPGTNEHLHERMAHNVIKYAEKQQWWKQQKN